MVLASLIAATPPEPPSVSISSSYPVIPVSGASVQTWTCGERVATLQTSWTTTAPPGEVRRREGMEIAVMIGASVVEEPAFVEFRETVAAFEFMPAFYAECAGDRFVIRAFTIPEQAVWYEPR